MHSKKAFLWILIVSFVLGIAGTIPAQNHVYVKAAPSGAWADKSSYGWEDIPDLVLTFEQMDDGYVSIAFSAEAFTNGTDMMWVRAVANGNPASPSDVVLVPGDWHGVNAFVFVAQLTSGVYEVKMQWFTGGAGTVTLGDRTMVVTSAPWYTFTQAAPSGPSKETTSSSFAEIPDLGIDVSTGDDGIAIVAVTAEAYTSGSARMFVAASNNTATMTPSDVVFVNGGFTGTRAFTFVHGQALIGDQAIRALWRVDAGNTAYLGDRTFTLSYRFPGMLTGGAGGFQSISAPSGPDVSTTSSGWVDIPDLNAVIDVPENATLAVSLTAEAETSTGERIFVRALLGDQVLSPSDVVFSTLGFCGTTRFDFVAENLPAATLPVKVQWHVDGSGTGYLGDRNMTITGFSAPGTGVDGEQNGSLPETWALEQNFPNPFNAATVIGYQVPEAGRVTLKVFDSRGGEIQTLVNEEKPAGRYQAVFHGDDLPTGIYVCRLTTGSQTSSRKMLLLR